jgi:hypothetical protein
MAVRSGALRAPFNGGCESYIWGWDGKVAVRGRPEKGARRER